MLPFLVIVATHPRPFTLRLGGLVPLQFTFLIFLLTDHCPLITAHYRFKSFNCNTYGPPRKCCKQKTYCMANSFRCNTYKKVGGYILQDRSISRFGVPPNPFLTSLPPYFITLRAALGAGGSRASGRRRRW